VSSELAREIASLTPAQRALLELRLGRRRPAAAAATIPLAPRAGGTFPASFAQQRLWLIEQLQTATAAYNLPGALRLHGALDLEALQRALDEIVRRHESLRTVFQVEDGLPVQALHPTMRVPCPLVDLRALPPGDPERVAREVAMVEARQPFDLERGPLLRVRVLRLAESDHVVLYTMHHIVSDGWSMGILLREITELYEAFQAGLPSPLPELPIQYVDFAAWQRKSFEQGVLHADLAYWTQRLAGAPPVLDLPTDRPRPAVQSLNGAGHPLSLPGPLTRSLGAVGQAEGATLFMTLLAIFQVLLSRYSGQEDLCVGTPIAGRQSLETESLIGFFANTLVIRSDLSGDPAFRSYLARVRERVLEAYAHQRLPFDHLVEVLQPERSLQHSPLFQVMLAFQSSAGPLANPAWGVDSGPALGMDTGTSKFDLTLALAEQEGALRGVLEYSTDLYETATIARLSLHLRALAEEVALDPERPLSELPLLTAGERAELLVEWNDTARAYPEPRPLHELIAEQAGRTPQAVAAVFEGEELSYRSLEAGAEQIAGRLAGLGIGPDCRVGVFLERSLDLIVALLGVMKAGGAYLPLDPSYPPERLEFLISDARSPVIITAERLASRLPATGGAVVVCLDGEARRPPASPAPAPRRPATPDDLAYVIYTSGSTGRPKGVMTSHRALCNRLFWMQEIYGLTAGDRVLQKTPFSFDVSVWELFWPLLVGARLVLARPGGHQDSIYLARLIEQERITVLHFVPSMLDVFLAEPDLAGCRSLQRVICSGEALQPALVARFFERLGPMAVELHNLYGPTEAAIDVTFWPCAPGDRRRAVPIGRPIANTRIHLLDARLQLVPAGVVGELYIAGVGLARGYLDRPALTAERFLPDPHGGPGERMYRTGDRVRRAPDGALEYLGRFDHQVKIRGARVELGEIEAVLREHPAVRGAAVIVREDEGRSRLIAYLVPDPTQPPAAAELRELLARKLPEVMIPVLYVMLDALPLSPNGKLDLRALPAPAERPESPLPEPLSPVEEMLAAIWSEVLKVERIGARESFFDLGGHSLLASRVVARIRNVFGVEIPLRNVFEAPVLAALAAKIEAAMRAGEPAGAPRIERLSREEDLPLSFAQRRLWFLHQINPVGFAYNIPMAVRLRGPLDIAALSRSLEEIARRHESLRTTFPVRAGEPVQSVHPPLPLPLPLADLRGLPQERREELVLQLAAEEARRPFDLARGPLWRVSLLRLAEQEHAVLLTLHHIVSDDWSFGIFLAELKTLYRSHLQRLPAELPELPVQYADYSVWQLRWLQGEVLERYLGYWRQTLADLPTLELPTDRPRPRVQTFRGRTCALPLSAGFGNELRAVSRRQGVTMFMAVLAAVDALLGRWTGQETLVVGTPVANRSRAEIEGVIGFFVNTLVLRAEIEGDLRIREVFSRAREVALGAYTHQDLPFEKLVEELQPERDLSRSPLFQVMLGLQDDLGQGFELAGLALEPIEVGGGGAKLDLTFGIRHAEPHFSVSLEYNLDLFDGTTISRLLGSFAVLLAGMVADPERRLSELPLLEASEREQLLVEWNDTAAPYSAQSCLHELFEARVQRSPDAVALVDSQQTLTYAELNRRANRWARALRRLGAGPERFVGILLDRSADMVAALLAVLKSGAAYVPLDPTYPADRLALIAADARIDVLLTETPWADLLPREGFRTLFLDDANALPASEEDLGRLAEPEDLAYAIYTSGSTGRPKGVEISHRALVNFLESMRRAPGMEEGDCLLAVTSLSFDIAGLEMYLPLLSGGRVWIVDREKARDGAALLRELASSRADVLQATPSTWRLLLEVGWEGSPALRALCGGEALPPDLAVQLAARCGSLWNVYGPTETTIWSTIQKVEPQAIAPAGAVPIGAPLANTQIYLLDRFGQPVLPGAVGEIYIGGDGVARGYLRRPDLTAERFLPDPFAPVPGRRLYRTGDLGRRSPEGVIVFLGRADHQVKLRGFRIEPGEIESALTSHPAVREAVVVAAAGSGDSRRLIAYLVPESPPGPGAPELRSFLESRLPDYMVPATFIALRALPRTPNGKLDRRALPAPEPALTPGGGERYVAPRTPVEADLAALWAEVLGVEQVGVEDGFFALGGHSLLATRLMYRISEALHVELPLRALFERPTVAGLADAIARSRAEQAEDGLWSPQPPIVPDAERRYEPFPLTDVQQAYWIGRSGSFELGNVASHNYLEMDITGLEVARFNRALQRVIDRHDMLRAIVLPDGRQQVLADVQPYAMEILDLRACHPEERQAHLDEVRKALSHQVLPTDRWPLFDIRASLLEGERVRLHFSLDYLLVDAWSNAIIFRELTELYSDPDREVPPLELTFRDCVLAEGRTEGSPLHQRAWEYWRRRIPELPPAPDLPLAQSPSRLERPTFVRRRASLAADRWRRLKEKAVQAGLTPSGVLLAAYAEVLAAWSRRARFAINLTLFSRPPLHPQILDIVGDFTSLTLLAVDGSCADTFRLRARAIQEQLWDDLDHRQVGGVRVLRELARQQQRPAESLMPVVFTSTLVNGAQPPAPAVSHETALEVELGYSISQTSQVWLDHQVQEEGGALTFNWDAVDEIFPPGLVDDLFGAYVQLLDRLMDDDSAWDDPALRLVPAAQLAIRARVNATQAAIPEGTLQSLLLQQVSLRGDQPAVIAPQRTLSYSELDRRSLALALQLRELGTRPNRLVAVLMEKGWEQVVAVLGILRAGAAYLPIESSLPAERQKFLLAQGEVSVVVTQPWLEPLLERSPEVTAVVVEGSEPPQPPAGDPGSLAGSEDLAYVIFTSGSTGQPKGVMIDHRGALNTLVDLNHRFGVGPEDRVLGLSSLSFDLSVYDIFGVLGAGGCLVLPEPAAARDPERWADLIERDRVTLWNSVPALMEMLVEHAAGAGGSRLAPLRLAMLSGDWIPVGLPDRIRELNPGMRVISLGGATEASIWSILYPIERVEPGWASIPYGQPMVNQTFHVLDDSLADRPTWVPGELFIGGIGVAQGYWRDAEKTAARFLRHPRTGERLYRTGDLGRYLPDGNIEFLGREDFQVKIQGYRIELGEIETALERHPAVRAGVVQAVGENRNNRRLVAYVVPDKGGPREDPSRDELPRDLTEHRSHRRFAAKPVPFARLSELLAALMQLELPESPLPKYQYPSAGSLYPVQTYLVVRPERVEGVPGGCYYYHPKRHCLLRVSSETVDRDLYAATGPAPQAADTSAFSLFLVSELSAIAPVYGKQAYDFSVLEAGYMSQLLAVTGAGADVGFAAVDFDRQRLHRLLGLGETQLPIHGFVSGPIDPADFAEDAEADATAAGAVPAATPGEIRLSNLAIDALTDEAEILELKLRQPGLRTDRPGETAIELVRPEPGAALVARFQHRRSHREFSREPVQGSGCTDLLALSARLDPRLSLYLDVRPGRVSGVEAGLYRYEAREHRLVPIAQGSVLSRELHAEVNRPIFDRAAFSLLLIARNGLLLEAGAVGQVLMSAAPYRQIGLCPIGSLELDRIRSRFPLAEEDVLLHSFLGGGIRAESAHAPGFEEEALIAELRELLGAQLPAYMIPSGFIFLDELPLSDNGKVDRKVLPSPSAVERRSAGPVLPGSALEQKLAGIFAEVLRLDRIDVHDNFFDLGGNSLHAVRIHARAQEALGHGFRITEIFKYPSVSALAGYLSQERGASLPTDEIRERAEKQRNARMRRRRPAEGEEPRDE
jgi:amino acid adenylation domain-containing protein